MQKDIESDAWGYGIPIIAPIIWAIIVAIGHTLYYIEEAYNWLKNKLKQE